jgi:arginine/ornithine N-succinyltransferase beta subunit
MVLAQAAMAKVVVIVVVVVLVAVEKNLNKYNVQHIKLATHVLNMYIVVKIVMDEKNGYSEVHVMHIPRAFTLAMNQQHRTKKQNGILCALHSHM